MSMELNDVSGCQTDVMRCHELSKYVREDVKELTQKIMSDNHGAMAKHTTINHWDQGN